MKERFYYFSVQASWHYAQPTPHAEFTASPRWVKKLILYKLYRINWRFVFKKTSLFLSPLSGKGNWRLQWLELCLFIWEPSRILKIWFNLSPKPILNWMDEQLINFRTLIFILFPPNVTNRINALYRKRILLLQCI